jgi:DNA-binding ferritin-like protein
MSDERETYGSHTDSIYAVWHDPMTYDHLAMGPPYLPEPKVRLASDERKDLSSFIQGFNRKADADSTPLEQIFSHLISSYQGLQKAELAALLSCLRAGALIHQTHHWQTRGDTFYGDHLLYERLYNESLPLIDQIAERAVGSGGHLLVHPVIQSSQIHALVKHFCGDVLSNPTPDEYALVSLVAEVRILAVTSMVLGLLEQKGQLSHGTDNLLQGVSDKHEEFVYLLRQRCQSKVSYDRR